jgi:NADH:ubiquinone oxidoreductase subunit F (NADH-binding)
MVGTISFTPIPFYPFFSFCQNLLPRLVNSNIILVMADLIEKIKDSGLTGRGGAGFPTGKKWEAVKNAPGTKKYIIANGSEGELAVEKDGWLLENYPEEIINGIKLALEYLEAEQAFLYLRQDYFEKYQENLKKIIGDWPMEIFREPGGYLCGEETTLIESMEGKRLEPREKPPYPTESGLENCPTLVNNLETFYAVAKIAKGEYKQERLYTLSGDIPHPGVFELPEDWPIEKILHKTLNWPPEDFFVQAGGGASGTIFTSDELEGKISGSGALVVYNREKTDLKALMKKWLDFYFQENCGKCVPCREGVYRLRELLNQVAVDWELVKEICLVLREASFCPLGKSVAAPMESFIAKVIKK